MRRVLTIIAALMFAATGAQASIIEDTTGEHYQDDAGEGEDASDACLEGLRPAVKPLPANGILVPVDDEADHWLIPGNGRDGRDRTISVHTEPLDDGLVDGFTGMPGNGVQARYTVDVLEPTCQDVVASAVLDSGEDGELTYFHGDAGDYVLRIVLEELTLEGESIQKPGGLHGAIPMNDHCSPWCAQYSFAEA